MYMGIITHLWPAVLEQEMNITLLYARSLHLLFWFKILHHRCAGTYTFRMTKCYDAKKTNRCILTITSRTKAFCGWTVTEWISSIQVSEMVLNTLSLSYPSAAVQKIFLFIRWSTVGKKVQQQYYETEHVYYKKQKW